MDQAFAHVSRLPHLRSATDHLAELRLCLRYALAKGFVRRKARKDAFPWDVVVVSAFWVSR